MKEIPFNTEYLISKSGEVVKKEGRYPIKLSSRNKVYLGQRKKGMSFSVTDLVYLTYVNNFDTATYTALIKDPEVAIRPENLFLVKKTYRGSPWPVLLLQRSKSNCKRAYSTDLTFDLTIKDLIEQYEEQQGLSYYLKIPMDTTMTCKLRAISIDRINNDKGYGPGNFKLVTRFENLGRASNSHEEMLAFVTSHL